MTKIGARNAADMARIALGGGPADKAAAQRHAMTKNLRGGIPV
jgi:hypothetical protein